MSELTTENVEKAIPKDDKRLEMYLMGLAYDIIQKNKGIKEDQISLLVSASVQKRDPFKDFGLYGYTLDKQSKNFKLKKVDWSKALPQYSQEKISQWSTEAASKGMNLQDYLLNNISKNLVVGAMHSRPLVDAGLSRMLSGDCNRAAMKNFDEKSEQVKEADNTVWVSKVQKALER